MNLRNLLLANARRWYVGLVGLLMSAGLGYLSWTSIPVSHEVQASVLLLPPRSSVGAGGNPYLYLGGLGQASEVLVARMNAGQVRGEIERIHPDATLQIAKDASTTGPIIAISVSSTSSADALDTLRSMLNLVPGVLLAMQVDLGVPNTVRITSAELTVDKTSEQITDARDRGAVAATGAGAALTFLGVGLYDGLRRRGSGRARSRRAVRVQEWPTESDVTEAAGGPESSHYAPSWNWGDTEDGRDRISAMSAGPTTDEARAHSDMAVEAHWLVDEARTAEPARR